MVTTLRRLSWGGSVKCRAAPDALAGIICAHYGRLNAIATNLIDGRLIEDTTTTSSASAASCNARPPALS